MRKIDVNDKIDTSPFGDFNGLLLHYAQRC